MHRSLIVPSILHNYEIEFIGNLKPIENLMQQPNTITIIDSKVANLYPTLNKGILVESTEKVKTLEGVENLLNKLVENKANVKTKLIVIGGGILQDVAGFCASIYSRGIEYILIPTTLLAQADSCIGGKTSINFNHRKNLIGTFYPPSKILICSEFLKTLSELDYISGLGEIYKFHILQNKINNFSKNRNIDEMIYEGLSYKIGILQKDEFDRGERRFLNYGHTFGHALEISSNNEIPHGVAVIIGSMIATRIAHKLGYAVNNYEEIIIKGTNLVKDSKLILQYEWFNLEYLLEIIKSDKKSTGLLTMVLVDDKPFLENINNLSILEDILKETYESI